MTVFDFAEQYLMAPMGITTLAEIKEKGGLMDPFVGFELRTLDLAKYGYLVMNKGLATQSGNFFGRPSQKGFAPTADDDELRFSIK